MFFKEASQEEIDFPLLVAQAVNKEDLEKYDVVSTKKYQLRGLNNGSFFQFYPVTFNLGFISSVTISLHSSPLEFKFRSSLLQAILSRSQKPKLRCQGSSDILLERIDPTKPIPKETGSKTLPDFLFNTTKSGTIFVSREQVKLAKKVYIDQLTNIYESLRLTYTVYLKSVQPKIFFEMQGI